MLVTTVAELRRNAEVRELAQSVMDLASNKLVRLVDLAENEGYNNYLCVQMNDLCIRMQEALEFLREGPA